MTRSVYIKPRGNGYRLIDIKYGWTLIEIQDDEIDQVQVLEDFCKKVGYRVVKSPMENEDEK